MSAPPIGMISSTPSASAMIAISQKSSALPDITRPTMKNTSASASSDVDDVARRQDDRRAAHAARQFQERDHRAGEGQRADGDAERHFDQALRMDVAGRADVEGFGRIERAGRDQHRGHADQRVERRDQFRHRGHRHPARDHRADAAADGDAEDHQHPGRCRRPADARPAWSPPRSPCRSCRRNCPGGWRPGSTARAATG